MKTVKIFLLGLFFLLVLGRPVVHAQPADEGAFSAYLIGTWEQRFGCFTVLHVINPTPDHLTVVFAFYDDKEEFLKSHTVKLTPYDLHEIHVKALGFKHQFGIVRIISYKDSKPVAGIVGFQRHGHVVFGISVAFSETVLASVPSELAAQHLPMILEMSRREE